MSMFAQLMTDDCFFFYTAAFCAPRQCTGLTHCSKLHNLKVKLRLGAQSVTL